MYLTSSLYRKYCLILFVSLESIKPVTKRFILMDLDYWIKAIKFKISIQILFLRKHIFNLFSEVQIISLKNRKNRRQFIESEIS